MNNNIFQIISTSYKNLYDKPSIILYGRDNDGKYITYQVTGFRPYFYARPKNPQYVDMLLSELKDIDVVDECVEDYKYLPFGYQKDRVPIIKIFVKKPGDVPKIRDDVLNNPFVDSIYEADVIYAVARFFSDTGLSGMGWCEAPTIDDPNNIISYNDIKSINIDYNAPIKIMGFDIECKVPEKGVPTATKDQITLISVAFNQTHDNIINNIVLVARPGLDIISGDATKYYNDEHDMLEAFLELIQNYNPDVIVEFNGDNFDFPYLDERLKQNNIINVMGRDGSALQVKSFGNKHEIRITGRAVADLYTLVKNNYQLPDYKLKTISKTLLKREKLDVSVQDMKTLWDSNLQSDLDKFIDYSRRDAVLLMDLALDLNIIDKYVAISRECGCLLHDTINSGQSVKIESMLLREFVKEDRLFPMRPKKDISDEDPDQQDNIVQGAHVFDPITGYHENLIVMDFKSLYPSAVRSHNICWTTVLSDYDISNNNDYIDTPSGGKYVKHAVYHGIMPRILDHLYDKRVYYKNLMKSSDNDRDKAFYDAMQYSCKILLNSFYGYTGAQHSRMFLPILANSITSIGRETIQLTQRTAESLLDCKVIGGDTDSIFLKLLDGSKDPEDGERAAKIIHDAMFDKLPPPMEIDFEAFAKSAILFRKKRYCMWVFEKSKDGWHDKLKMRGIETRRRDWAPIVGETMTTAIDLILKKGDIDGAYQYCAGVINDIRNLRDIRTNEQLADKLIMTRGLSRDISDYNVEVPHVNVCKKMEKRGETPYGLGDRVSFFALPGALDDSLSRYADTPEYVRSTDGRIDNNWYIRKQIEPPLERLFGALGIDFRTGKKILKEGSLLDFKPSLLDSNNNDNKDGEIMLPNKKSTGLFAFI